MNIAVKKSHLKGCITVPGSKSHTIRALLLAALSDGTCHIKNPLESQDCIATAQAVPLMNAKINFDSQNLWTVEGAGSDIRKPCDVVNVKNSGSLLYFLSPIAATFQGWSVFSGDESIRKRPIKHLLLALEQLGAKTYLFDPNTNAPPILIFGPIKSGKVVTQGEVSSQYISGLMMAALRLEGETQIELTCPKETPYLTMTQKWLQKLGADVFVSKDFKNITIRGPLKIEPFDVTIPCDWEAVAFPLIAALISRSNITIDNIDSSGTQGDDKIVEVLQLVGAPIFWDKTNSTVKVNATKDTYMTTQNLKDQKLVINLSSFPDAICALAAVACFVEGTVVLDDIEVCRNKETDRVEVLQKELSRFGAKITTSRTSMTIYGNSPVTKEGKPNKNFSLHPATAKSHDDHRVAMALSCLSLGLEGESIIENAQCCAVSFPTFFSSMKKLGANFVEI